MDMLQEPDNNAKRAAIKALEQHPATVSVDALGRMLDDEDASIRTAAVGSLGKFKSAAGAYAQKLHQISSDDPDKRVQEPLVFANTFSTMI